MGPRRCILHIGICKTGTTSIQHALAAQRQQLAAAGIVVPHTLGPTHNHRQLTLLAVDGSTERGQREWAVMRQRHPALEACATAAEGRAWLEQQLAAELASQPDHSEVVFSSEQLSQRLLSDAEVWRLQEVLSRLGLVEVKVVVYVREQVGLALSWDSMEVLAGGGTERLAGAAEHFDHRALLERWERVWGREALQVRTYARPCLEGGDIVRDFLTHGLGLPERFRGPSDQPWRNPRLGRRSLWLLRQANRWLPRLLPSGAVEPVRQRCLQAAQSPWLGGGVARASQEEIANTSATYGASNAWVDARYGTQLQASLGRT